MLKKIFVIFNAIKRLCGQSVVSEKGIDRRLQNGIEEKTCIYDERGQQHNDANPSVLVIQQRYLPAFPAGRCGEAEEPGLVLFNSGYLAAKSL